MKPTENRRKKILSYLLRFIVAAGALYLIFRGEDIRSLWEVLSSINLLVFAVALAVYLFSQLFFVARWYLLLRVQSIHIGLWPAVKLHAMGLFYNNCLPTSVGGDFLRAWYVRNHTDKKLEAVLSVFVDRVIGFFGIVIMASIAYWFVPEGAQPATVPTDTTSPALTERIAEYKTPLVIAALLIAVAVLIFLSTARGRSLLQKAWNIAKRGGKEMLIKIHSTMLIYYNKKMAILGALLLSFGCQGIFVISLWIIGTQIGADVNPKYYFIFFPISWLIGALPISVGGLGIMEGWLKMMFVDVAGLSSRIAVVLALCQRLILLCGSVPGMIIHLIGAHLPGERIEPTETELTGENIP